LRVRILILLLCGLYLPFTMLCGQDVHFSQYFNNPLAVNPSQTGDFEGNWRVAVNYRNQWMALNVPYRTMSASYDQVVYSEKNKFSAGLYFVNDRSGDLALKVNRVCASGSWNREVNGFGLSGGLQLGYVLRSVDPYTMPENYNYRTYNFESVSPGESMSYLDINVGVAAKRKFGRFDLESGLAVYHLNHPNESFTGANMRLPLKYLFNTAVRTEVMPNLYLKPGMILGYMGGANDIIAGSQVGYTIQGYHKVNEVNGGLFVRNGLFSNLDAIVIMGGVQIKSFNIAVSYDINVSSLSSYGKSYGAFEISIIYRNISAPFKIFTIPCERI
jgi:type IX secretion system PorP/SprF family membrane protein